ncbi:peptidoglycan-binding protein [Suttonella sp. R2A3]|uniref:peptidoglycan-binding domain-containing protein n=1 Tax=Suttonella sp. R2A3 TaxID=2908648 RepID=UPI001F20DC37|nr:peptidoglycan-binding protein [Suttonella sp. R2A3]UJF24724.1 peptidoglycan-binding protein [Suttonella sp. R2A3]
MNNLKTVFTLSALSAAMWLSAPVFGQEACDDRAFGELVRHDDVEALRSYAEECDVAQKDVRGFSLYDRALLQGSEETIAWLESNNHAKKGEYSEALIKLVQTGLRYLDMDAGVIDGDLGDQTRSAIKTYQKKYGFSVDGEFHPAWMADFYRRLVKKTQQGLDQIGFEAGTPDGIIGDNTVSAMQGFRQERQMPAPDYADLDDQLIYQLMMVLHEHHKDELAKRDAERKARQVAQEAARREQEAKARAEAQRKAEEERRAAERAAKEAERERQANEQRMQKIRESELQSSLNNVNILPNQSSVQQTQAARIAQEKAALEARLAAERAQQEAKAKRDAEAAKIEEERAKREAAEAKAAQERAQREAEVARQEAEQARREAQAAFTAVKRNEPVKVSDDIQQATQVQGAKTMAGGFQELNGILRHNGRSSCSVNGQNIEASWCESVYQESSGKNCNVILTPSGLVVSFLCD